MDFATTARDVVDACQGTEDWSIVPRTAHDGGRAFLAPSSALVLRGTFTDATLEVRELVGEDDVEVTIVTRVPGDAAGLVASLFLDAAQAAAR